MKSLEEHSANFGALVLVAVTTIAVVVGGYALFSTGALDGILKKGTSGTGPAAVSSSPSNYVAVFLSNKQVYFGKLNDAESSYPTLSDVFYLRVSQVLAPGAAGAAEKVSVAKADKDATPAAAARQVKNELTLIKLGAEIHGPTDSIRINRDHILFIETLKDDSKVVKAITDYRQKNP